ncbi:DUF1003 domain-containing protein [Pseudoduganella sp. UC29_71]|uniref:DUF1003 domain-containing protein n=1 Tax=Pseudoduganella sp. UC29_71 TaxID=3350174 RepID=UPI00366D536A
MPSQAPAKSQANDASGDHLRFHRAQQHLAPTFGNDRFAKHAEAFARFFGTPLFLGAQTVIVVLWIGANVVGLVQFDHYPFILLNLAFSLQAAYAAPLILLAQTRQAARDMGMTEADARHREALAITAGREARDMHALLRQNTELTTLTNLLAARIETLTVELHRHVLRSGDSGVPSSAVPASTPPPD